MEMAPRLCSALKLAFLNINRLWLRLKTYFLVELGKGNLFFIIIISAVFGMVLGIGIQPVASICCSAVFYPRTSIFQVA